MIRSFDGTMQSLGSLNYQTKLSSAGLVYLHYGRRVIDEIIGRQLESSLSDIIYDKVYENFIEEIDAIDNGISQTDEIGRYNISQTILYCIDYRCIYKVYIVTMTMGLYYIFVKLNLNIQYRTRICTI